MSRNAVALDNGYRSRMCRAELVPETLVPKTVQNGG